MPPSLTISHDAGDGTVVHGTARGDGSRAVLRTYGLRWGRALGAWYVPNSRARRADTVKIDGLAAALRAAGFTVEIDTADITAVEAEAARAELADTRAVSLRSRAQRLEERAARHHADARQILDVIPAGQPILVGHHSEPRHRRDLGRVEGSMQQAAEAQRAAQDARRRAEAAATEQARREGLPAVGRRIDRLTAETASLQRRIDGTASAPAGPATGDYLVRLTRELSQTSDDLAFWTARRDELLAAGAAREWTRAHFVPGDRIVTVKGHAATVRRVNAKTLTVHYDVMPDAITNPVRYYDVRHRLRGPDEAGQQPSPARAHSQRGG